MAPNSIWARKITIGSGLLRDVCALRRKHGDGAVGFPLESGRILAKELAAPPETRCAFRLQVGEPILVDHRAHAYGRRARKRIGSEQGEDVWLICEQTVFGPDHEAVLGPGTERGKPQVPIETRLIGRVNSRRVIEFLRLVAKFVR